MRFVDTNVLLYSLSTDHSERMKATAARALLHEGDLCLSAQVLQEFYVQSTRPAGGFAITHAEASAFMATLAEFPIEPITASLVLAASATCQRFRISYWDAAIIEAARLLGCEVVLSEDLADGQDYDGVRVVNPFA